MSENVTDTLSRIYKEKLNEHFSQIKARYLFWLYSISCVSTEMDQWAKTPTLFDPPSKVFQLTKLSLVTPNRDVIL